MRAKKKPIPSLPKLIAKGLTVLLLGYLLLELFWFSLIAISGLDRGSDVDYISWCADDYARRDYEELYGTLTLFDLYSEEYDLYWEAVNGYNTYLQCLQYQNAARQGMENADTLASDALAKLETMAASPQFSQNGPLLQGFLDALE